MSEPFYAAALYAVRIVDDATHIGASVAVVHPGAPQVTGDELALGAARNYFPSSEGWDGHHAITHELNRALVDTITAEAGLPFVDDSDRIVCTLLTRVEICDHCGARASRIEPDIEDEP